MDNECYLHPSVQCWSEKLLLNFYYVNIVGVERAKIFIPKSTANLCNSITPKLYNGSKKFLRQVCLE